MITSGCCSRNWASRKVRDAAQQAPPRRAGKTRITPKPSGAVEALQIVMTGDPAGPDIGTDGLAELVLHYAHALAVAPSAAVYGELLSARSFAGTLLGRSSPRQRPDLTITAGWLSSLLAISAADLGEHAAAVIWCTDTDRRGRDAAYPELLGWAALTRSLIAWYQGDPLASAAVARRGQADLLPGSAAGTAALECGRVVWPTMVLAGKLDKALAGQFLAAACAADFHARYLEAGTRIALPAPPGGRPARRR